MHTGKKLLIINGSLRGMQGNSGALALKAQEWCRLLNTDCTILNLAGPLPSIQQVADMVEAHSAFLVISGVYWSNFGSPLQRFIEVMTAYENTPVFFGKPVACALSVDSVGGSDVAARIHSIFSGLGCWSPPCSTLIVSRTGQEAIDASTGKSSDVNEDVWRPDDLEIVMANLVAAMSVAIPWQQWPIGRLDLSDGPWPATGEVDLDSPRFL